jgi:glycosyltransferase involved in cell wall biosynthesis
VFYGGEAPIRSRSGLQEGWGLMRILAFAKYGQIAASTRQRILQYLPFLHQHGIEVDVCPLLSDEYLIKYNKGIPQNRFAIASAYIRRAWQAVSARRYDAIFVHYELFPYMPAVFERLVFSAGKPVIVDYDDAVFHTYDCHPNPVLRRLLTGKLQSLLSGSAAAICGNRYLAEYAKQFCSNTIVIPTVVDTDLYRPKAPHVPPRQGPPVIGWLGSPSTWQNVEPCLNEILAPVAQQRAQLHVIGANSAFRQVAGVVAKDWSEQSEISDLQAMDIGIMPLIDAPFQRGKCGYKLVQYMACGLPVIASPVGVNTDIVEEGRNGFLASSGEEWRGAIDRLLRDPDLRMRMGQEGRRLAEERYSLAVHQVRMLEVLRPQSAKQPGARTLMETMHAN